MEINEQNGKLSAEVEPFVPQKKGAEAITIPMSISGDGGNAGGLEATPIPSYLITCYPFVQENQSNRQFPLYVNDVRWQQSSSNPPGPYLAYPIVPTQPPVSTDYMYYQLMPAPCAQVMGFYHPFPTTYTTPVQATNPVNAISIDCNDRTNQQAQISVLSSQRSRNATRPPIIHKQPQQLMAQLKCKRPPMKSVAVQKESCSSVRDTRSKIVLLVDACQQTDFPSEIANKSLSESIGGTPWKTKARRRRSSHPAAESSSEQGASEADIDSDSGYCSPKHCQAAAMCSRHTECTASAVSIAEPAVCTAGGNWTIVASQATQKRPWNEKSPAFSRGGRQAELRNNQLGYRMRGQSTSSERRQNIQRKQDNKTGTIAQLNRTDQSPEQLFFEDEDEFPELNSSSGSSRNENPQPKIAAKVLDDLPDNSPINIVQTPIPITTSVPKRAKSQKKKALAAALATAQEYSEISMEQKKLQEALSKASGKKSKTPVQLDLGDMLAELERQQQAMKARQITNTRPLSYTVGSAVPFHTKEHTNRNVFTKAQTLVGSPNPLDSTAPRVKRGKEKEVPKLKRPTALKKIILKEREEKKGRLTVDQSVLSSDEQKDIPLSFADDQSEELASQEEAQSDTSLSPASQNSPYCMTPVSQGSPASSGIGSPMASSAITKIHSKRFREYCNQVLSKEIDECVTVLLQELVSFQEQEYTKDSTKAKLKRRLVMGLREVTKHMKLNKIKCVIISPNCEKIQSKGGLDEALYNVIAMAREQEIPFVFALGRKALGRCVNKLVPVSVVGIFSYSGAESLFNNLVSLTEEARKAYKDMVASMEQEQAEEALKNVKKVSHHMGHSRNPSAASAISFCSVISEPISEVNEKDYETNWRSMVETSDGVEASENEDCSVRTMAAEHTINSQPDKSNVHKPLLTALDVITSVSKPSKVISIDKEEVKPDDNLEWASQQSTETGSWDGSGRDVLNSSIISTTSTLVPEMLEDDDDDDEEEDDDEYHQEPTTVSRIESWVSETQRTMETLQLVNSPEEDNIEQSEEDDMESTEQVEPVSDCKERTAEKLARNGSQSDGRPLIKESSNSNLK
ncbi:selenocysteine insertion sequence-binding protein 2-like [Pseudophryne corroboree]|uniref:selenocysteine insertion sequence-binding protein 2-like n=1 Tax=Pseudophryne corroboree TaxID=495146 RepID=UPI0030816330